MNILKLKCWVTNSEGLQSLLLLRGLNLMGNKTKSYLWPEKKKKNIRKNIKKGLLGHVATLC